MAAYATIIVPGLAPYRITAADRLWAGRAAQYEGGESHADTLWTWTQRYALPGFRRRYRSLAELIKAHSQPVNPIWRRTGSKCRPGGQYHGRPNCAENRLRVRDTAARIRFDQLRPQVQQTVNAWASGVLPNPVPQSVDFAVPDVVRSFMERNPGSRIVKQAGNWFVSTPASQRWGADHVRMVPATGAQQVASILVPALVIGSAVALTGSLVYLGWRRRA